MRDWKFWEWVAYASLFIAAIFQAISAASTQLPDFSKQLPFLYLHLWDYVPVALIVLATIILVVRLTRQKSVAVQNRTENSLKVLQVKLEFADNFPKVNYKRKLRIVVKNVTDTDIIVGPSTSWVTGELKVRSIPQQVWELEPADGWHSGKWTHAEQSEINLPPGKACRTWIGLHPDATEEEIERLKGTLGTLVVPVKTVSTVRLRL